MKLVECKACGLEIYSPARFCLNCTSYKRLANKQVLQAVKKGLLPRVSGMSCVDCGEPAQAWEHRDYGKPMDVEATCQGCNMRRGPGTIPDFVAKFHKYIGNKVDIYRKASHDKKWLGEFVSKNHEAALERREQRKSK